MSTVIKYITTGGLYVLFGLWSFFQVLEYKYYTRVEQYDTIVENMRICKQKYIELLVKMTQLENRVDELEDILLEHNLDGEDLDEEEELEEEEEQLSLDAEALKKAELEELNEVKEVEQMANEEVITNVVENELSEVLTTFIILEKQAREFSQSSCRLERLNLDLKVEIKQLENQ